MKAIWEKRGNGTLLVRFEGIPTEKCITPDEMDLYMSGQSSAIDDDGQIMINDRDLAKGFCIGVSELPIEMPLETANDIDKILRRSEGSLRVIAGKS